MFSSLAFGASASQPNAPFAAMPTTVFFDMFADGQDVGRVTMELFTDHCPKTAENFLGLAASGHYDGTVFHRLIRDFIVQGGSQQKGKAKSKGKGKGDRNIYGTPDFQDEIVETLTFARRGVVAMANKGPNTICCQVFVTFKAQP